MTFSTLSITLVFAMAPQADCRTQLAVDGSDWNQTLDIPTNGIVWLTPLSGSETYTLDLMREDLTLIEAPEHGERVIYGSVRHAFGLPVGTDGEGCGTIVRPNPSGFSEMCIRDEVDLEAPLDPDQLSAKVSKPRFGTSSSDNFPAPRCSGLGSGGNLQVTVPTDEAGPLFALITVEQGGEQLVDGSFPFQGTGTFSFHVAAQGTAKVTTRLMDHAGNIGEPTSVEVDPPSGCSASPLGLSALLLGSGFRRRRRAARAKA